MSMGSESSESGPEDLDIAAKLRMMASKMKPNKTKKKEINETKLL